VNARQLEAFRAVARTGTVTAAAESMHISQPAVSRLLAHLELQLSLALFSRSKGRLRLTPEGSALLRDVERHFVGLDAIQLAARRIAEHGPGSLRVLGFPSMSSGVLPLAIAQLLGQHPDTAITLDTDTTDRIAACVESGSYDVGFTAGEVSQGHAVEARVIASRPWVCVFPHAHRLSKLSEISLRELDTETLVGFSPGMSLRRQIERMFSMDGLEPNFALSAQTIESMCALVASGCGVAIIHPYASHVARMHGLSTAMLDDPAKLELTVVTPQASARAQFVDEFVSVVESVYAQQATAEGLPSNAY
jgi:DNA-binding transcriptional LysR family regulator